MYFDVKICPLNVLNKFSWKIEISLKRVETFMKNGHFKNRVDVILFFER